VNWKASLFGALLVAVCGLAVGAAIGGKTKTKLVTVTERPAAAVSGTPTTPTSSTPEEETGTSSTGTSSTTPGGETTSSTVSTTTEPPAEGQQYLAEYLAGQESEKLNGDADSVQLSGEPSKQELQGQTYQQAVVFDISNNGTGNTASFQVPTPGFTRLSSKAVGLETISNAETFYKLTVYKNDDSSPSSVVLYHATFHGPSEVHKMDFALQGATDLLFVWTKSSGEPDSQDVFILADPVLTH
jgi:hypothetical protein